LIRRVSAAERSALAKRVLRLFGALPDQVSSSRTGGRLSENRDVRFISGDAERFFSLGPVKIRERTTLDVAGRVMEKMGATSVAELMIPAQRAEIALTSTDATKV
jgi:hypothetical protein